MTAQDESGQARVVAFLAAGAERISTHGAHIFLTGDRALKLKRAVKYPFMDFSTVEKRWRALNNEFLLNAPRAPGLYLGLEPVCETDGRLTVGGITTPLDWVLVMRRFEQEQLLSEKACAGEITAGMIDSLAKTLVEMHRDCPPMDRPEADYFERTALDNITVLRDAHCAGTDILETRLRDACRRVRDHLDRRAHEGFVRRCHGDLHLANIVMLNGRPTPFDALEFDDALATGDVFYDLAFLLMDLEHHQLRTYANQLLNRYVWLSQDIAGLVALPLFIATRAAVRAKVAVLRGAAEDAAPYVELAIRCLQPHQRRVVAFGGFSGTGKSAIARQVAPLFEPMPGAIWLRSDLIRKHHFGVTENYRLSSQSYTPTISRKVYQTMMELCRSVLATSYSVVMDAVFADVNERNQAAGVAAESGTPFQGIWLEAPLPVRLQRLSARKNDASDADAAVARTQETHNVGDLDWQRLRADHGLEDVVASVVKALALAHPSDPVST